MHAASLAANQKLADLESRIKDAHAASQERDRVIGLHDSAKQQLTNQSNKYDEKKQEVAAAVYPQAPTDASVTFNGQPDPRPRYAIIANGAILASVGLCAGADEPRRPAARRGSRSH